MLKKKKSKYRVTAPHMHELIPECESKIGAYMCLNHFDKLTHNERFLFCASSANTGKNQQKIMKAWF